MSLTTTSTTKAGRTSLDSIESNKYIEKANDLARRSDNAQLHIVNAQSLFKRKVEEFRDHDLDGSTNKQPVDISGDVSAQLSFLRKLKFHYLEQNAKDKYVKTIVNDDAPLITADDNDALRKSNGVLKAQLKFAKDKLAARHADIKKLSPEVEQDYHRVKSLTTEVSSLAQQILDARLALSRLRATHPHPRLTIRGAEATLEAQTDDMTALDSEISEIHTRVDHVKAVLQDSAREVERLRIERAEMEKSLREYKAEEEDGRIVGLYDWYSAALSLHRSLFSLHSTRSISENELALTYHISQPPRSTTRSKPIEVVLTLLFHPNTRQLADAHISCLDPKVNVDVRDVVGSHVQSNDIPGLTRALLARLRASL